MMGDSAPTEGPVLPRQRNGLSLPKAFVSLHRLSTERLSATGVKSEENNVPHDTTLLPGVETPLQVSVVSMKAQPVRKAAVYF